MSFPCVRIEGALIPGDILDQIVKAEAVGQRPQDFGLPKSTRLSDEISRAWQDALAYWKALQRSLDRLGAEDPATTQTREQWVVPLLKSLGYDKVSFMAKAAEVSGQTFAISHRAGASEDNPPLHIVGIRADLNARPQSGRPRLSPHALVQEYLNRTDHLWGIVTNGKLLRLLRDSSRMSRPSYVEFDLEQMMTAEKFSDFCLLYRLLHRTRLPTTEADASKCLLETYHQQGIEQGGRVRERLRDGVERVLRCIGQGLLDHPANAELRRRLSTGELKPEDYYCQLLRMVYRLLFLVVTEERKLLAVSDQNNVYQRYYSLTRLREVCARPYAVTWRHDDLWQGLLTTFALFADENTSQKLGLSPLNGSLFGPHAMPALENSRLANGVTLEALRHLSFFQDQKVTRRINYAALDVEELGSVYESLLDYHPIVREDNGRLKFDLAYGTERKSTGSYYTRPELVAELVKSALEPVIEAKLASAESAEEKAKALLSIKVCDPACGSGHFLLAAARRIGRELAKLRSGEDEPTPDDFRMAVREVIQHCIYGVDLNPLAVDLCKLALWIEGHSTGKPLSFLDHRIKCGNSLVGVFSLDVLKQGIPDDAYKPVTGDSKQAASAIRKLNRHEREMGRMLSLDLGRVDPAADLPLFAGTAATLEAIADDTPADVKRKADAYERARRDDAWWRDKTACDIWTAAFFTPLTRADDPAIPTTDRLWSYLEHPKAAHGQLLGRAGALSLSNRFFHWPLEFPEVFAQGGFDCVLGNPPWEQIQPEERKFFAVPAPDIARLDGEVRKRAIARLLESNPALYERWLLHCEAIARLSRFARSSGRYKLTAAGKLNTYALFAELARMLLGPTGRAGIIVPTGIATDASTSRFFGDLNIGKALVSLYDFENRKAIFPGVHRSYKFCLLSVSRKPVRSTDFAFFLLGTEDMLDQRRRYTLSPDDLALFNPNTRTCPTFRTRVDAELTRAIYQRVPVLVNEQTGENPWGVSFRQGLFNMTSDSGLFRTRAELEAQGFRLQGNIFVKGSERFLPLYEAKMIWHYDHRYGSYEGVGSRDSTSLPATRPDQYADTGYVPLPCYWVHESEVSARLAGHDSRWLLGFRDVTNATNERTAIFAAIPRTAVGHTMPIVLALPEGGKNAACLMANLNALAFDLAVRQKLAGTHMTYFILEQLPVLSPDQYSQADLDFIVPRVLELTYTAWDMKSFAEDMGYSGPPFKWDEDRRALLKAELDAYYAKLYGLTRKQLRYILDPHSLTDHELENILDPAEDPADAPRTKDFPGETFRVLKEKEIKQFGEYRTQRLVLQAWDRMFGG